MEKEDAADCVEYIDRIIPAMTCFVFFLKLTSDIKKRIMLTEE